VPGIETRLPLLFSEGVGKKQDRAHDLRGPDRHKSGKSCTGLYPRKGTIAVGADADIVIWDHTRDVTISNEMLHHACDYTPYEGMQVRGWARGRPVARRRRDRRGQAAGGARPRPVS